MEKAISPEASLGPRPRSASTSRGVRSAQQAVRPVAARQPAARADAVTSTAFSRATTPGVGHGARTGPSSKEEAFPRQADVKSPSTVRQSEAPHRPVSQRTSAAPRPNRCWAGSQADSSAAEAAIPEERAATASARPGGRRPLPPTSGSSGPTGLGPQKSSSRPSSAKGQSADPGGGSRKSLPAGGPLGGRSAYAYRGAAAAAAAAMEVVAGGDELGSKVECGQDPATFDRIPQEGADARGGNSSPIKVAESSAQPASSAARGKREESGSKAEKGEKGSAQAKSDRHDKSAERTDISGSHGPGAEGDPAGYLLGAENLPMVGAAGVLVLPKRHQTVEKPPEKPKKKIQVDFSDLAMLLAEEELDAWGASEEQPWQHFHRRNQQQNFNRYVEESVASGGAAADVEVDMEQVRCLTMEEPVSKPAQGPGIRQLAQEPARREECPVCNAEWAAAVRCMAEGRSPPAKEVLSLVPAKKQLSMGRKYQKMHSVQCNWAWFQQNLTSILCSLRFDPKSSAPRPSPPSPSSVLPPPMPDVLQYWKKAGRSDKSRDPGSPRESRLDLGA